jgi:hypothetical protein
MLCILCYVMLCYVMLCYAMLCYVMLCYVMLCYAMLCYVMLCYVMYRLYRVYSTLQYSPSMRFVTPPNEDANPAKFATSLCEDNYAIYNTV